MEPEELIRRIEEITATMDVPDFRRTSVGWLQKKVRARNASHPRMPELEVLLEDASRRGMH